MNVTRRGPATILTHAWPLQDEVNRLFDDFFGGGTRSSADSNWTPALDVRERPDGITIRAEIPGMSAEDVQINLTGNVLTMSGEKKQEEKTEKENFLRMERSFGSFHRTLTLPEDIDPEKVSATYEQGVLSIDVAKLERARPRTIDVKIK